MQATETLTFTDTTTISVQASNDPAFTVVDQAPPRDSGELTKDSSWTPFERGDGYINADAEASGTALVSETAARPGAGPAISEPGDTPPESDMVPGGQEPADTIDKDGLAAGATDSSQHAIAESAPSAGGTEEARVDNTPYPGATADDAESLTQITEPVTPSAPDPSTISARLKNLVVSISQVEELSRRAREAAASDLALFNGIAASQHQFEEGLAEARHLSQEAQAVYHRAFGREARAVAEPAVAEAREVEQAFADLADAWRHQAESFLSEHPDVELLLAEQDEQHEEARRHEAARARAQCLQELVAATDAALRQGQLDDARACLKQLGRDFPTEAPRLAPLQERLDHRVRAANDAAARRTLLQAAEFQGRGDFEVAVKLLEAVDVHGLSREASEGCLRALVSRLQLARPDRRSRAAPLLTQPGPRHHSSPRSERARWPAGLLLAWHGQHLLRGAGREQYRAGRQRHRGAGQTVPGRRATGGAQCRLVRPELHHH